MSIPINRRNLLIAGGACALLYAGSGLGTMLAPNRQLYRKQVRLMGGIAEIQVVHDQAKKAYQAIDAAFAEARRLENRMSRYQSNSDVGQANQLAFQQAVSLSPETTEVIQRGLAWSAASQGRFDPAIGKITELWSVNSRNSVPEEELQQALAQRSFYRNVQLNPQNRNRPFHYPRYPIRPRRHCPKVILPIKQQKPYKIGELNKL